METAIDTAEGLVAAYGLRIIAAAAILVLGKWLARALSNTLERVLGRAGGDPTLIRFCRNIAYFALFTFVVLAALSQLGVQTTSFIAVIGAAGLAVGLALQGSMSNFAAGVMLILFKPFKVGDYVEAGGAAGTVEEIMIFSTKLKSPDNKQLFVPNGVIFNGNIVNYSAKDTRRIDMVFGCGYDDDILRVKRLLEDIVAADERVLADPAVTIGLYELGESSINFWVRPWVNASDYLAVHFDIHEQVKLRFDAEGLSIPYPQRDVHLHQVAA